MQRILFITIVLAGLLSACSNDEMAETKVEIDRYCLALDLKPDSELMKEYKYLHTKEGTWKEIPVGILKSGCLDMEIYILDNHMFMIVDIPKGEDLDKVWERMGQYERQAEWAKFMLKFQQAVPGHGEEVKWVLMDKVYDLNDHY